MPVNLIKTVNFGTSKAGVSTVGYKLYNATGVQSGSRITSDVGEVTSNSGIYSASVHLAEGFTGYVLWDTGESTPVFASEDIDNVINTLTLVSSSVDFTKDMTAGRWKLDTSLKQMIFYKDDNSTVVARFGMSGSDGSPTVSEVHERRRL
jgi:hypothetical protein